MRFKNLDLNLLVVLSLLLATRSVSEAARRLNLSQPAVSAALSRLRDYFGDPLFVSHGRRMVPTAFAENLAPMVQRVISEVEGVTAATAVFDPATSMREFRIGASDYVCLVLLAPVLRKLQAVAPGVRLQLTPPSELMLRDLEAGDLDVIITPEEYLSPAHPSRLLFEEDHVVIGCANNPIFDGPLTEDKFYDAGHVAVEIGRDRRNSFGERAMSKLQRQRRIEVTATSFAVVPWLLPDTARLAVMHKRLAALATPVLPLSVAPLPFEFPKMKQMMQVHRTRSLDTGVNWLTSYLWAEVNDASAGGSFTSWASAVA